MCGRFTATWPSYEDLVRTLGVTAVAEDALLYRPRWNVAPMDRHWVVRLPPGGGDPFLGPASWGLAAPSRGAGKPARPLINARSETASRLPSFRRAFAERRCVVPVDGFYEWVGPVHARRPIWFHPMGGDLLRLAGLWEPGGGGVDGGGGTFTILTTSANEVVGRAHDRMPVVLDPADVAAWLGGPVDEASALLRPCPPAQLGGLEVSPRANRVANDDPACLDPWSPAMIDAATSEPKRPAPKGGPRAKTEGDRTISTSLPLFGDAHFDGAPKPLGRPKRSAKAE